MVCVSFEGGSIREWLGYIVRGDIVSLLSFDMEFSRVFRGGKVKWEKFGDIGFGDNIFGLEKKLSLSGLGRLKLKMWFFLGIEYKGGGWGWVVGMWGVWRLVEWCMNCMNCCCLCVVDWDTFVFMFVLLRLGLL